MCIGVCAFYDSEFSFILKYTKTPAGSSVLVSHFYCNLKVGIYTSSCPLRYQPSFHGVDLSALRGAAVDEYFRQPIVVSNACMHVQDFKIRIEQTSKAI